jgi:hypothetical protein
MNTRSWQHDMTTTKIVGSLRGWREVVTVVLTLVVVLTVVVEDKMSLAIQVEISFPLANVGMESNPFLLLHVDESINEGIAERGSEELR